MSPDSTPPRDTPRRALPPIKAPQVGPFGSRLLNKDQARRWARIQGRTNIGLPLVLALIAVGGMIHDPAHLWFLFPVVIIEGIAIKILWQQSEEIYGGPGAGDTIDPYDYRDQSTRRFLKLMKVILLIAAGFAYLVVAAQIADPR